MKRDSDSHLRVIDGGAVRSERADGDSESESASDRSQFIEQLFQRYKPRLLGYVTNLLRSEADAQDIVQETYIRLLEAKHLDRLESRVRGYMFKIATNLVRDHARRQRVRGEQVPYESYDLTSDEPQPDRVADWNQGLLIVKQALLDLTPRCRQVFLLHVAEHLSYREIAQRLDISKKTVERDIRLAVELCQSRLRIWER